MKLEKKHFTLRRPIFSERGGTTLSHCVGAGLAFFVFFFFIWLSHFFSIFLDAQVGLWNFVLGQKCLCSRELAKCASKKSQPKHCVSFLPVSTSVGPFSSLCDSTARPPCPRFTNLASSIFSRSRIFHLVPIYMQLRNLNS